MRREQSMESKNTGTLKRVVGFFKKHRSSEMEPISITGQD